MKWDTFIIKKAMNRLCKVMFISVILVCILIPNEKAYATVTNKVINPNTVCDVSRYSSNTNLIIKKSGTYTLTGKSNNVHVSIKKGDVKIFLENVEIISGADGDNTMLGSPINIEDQGGDVTLISNAGSSNKFSSALLEPAIKKDGTKTKLIFDTKDHSNPGKINVFSTASESAAIGSTPTAASVTGITGNIVFNGGIIEAESKTSDAAGIGGSRGGSCKNITINGGTITAKAVNGGAGIGAGYGGDCDGITINGGTIYATGGGNGAGIGSAESRSGGGNCKNITINGGRVTSIGRWGGAGIGAGWGGDVTNININGGYITATGGDANASGIGGGGGNFPGSARNITIRGGNIKASGGGYGSGIGISRTSTEETDINICGGVIDATGKVGSDYGFGIGGGENYLWYKCSVKINITGGTIKATGTGKYAGIGTESDNEDECSIMIDGGNIGAKSEKGSAISGPHPINAKKEYVYKTSITLDKADDDLSVYSMYMDNSEHEYHSYGLNDVYTIDGGNDGSKLYFYLPKDISTTVASVKELINTAYRGSIVTDTSNDTKGTLYRNTRIVLDKNNDDEGSLNGGGEVIRGDTQLRLVKKPVRNGYTALRYTFDKKGEFPEDNGTVFDTTYHIISPSLEYGNNKYSTSEHSWLYNKDATFYTIWRQDKYSIKFDSNVPSQTKSVLSGQAPSQMNDIEYESKVTLSENKWSLKGYNFNGWNTKMDGSGVTYSNEAEVSKLTTDGAITLYAIWEPIRYQIVFNGNSSDTGAMPSQVLVYDKGTTLFKCAYKKEGMVFAGWRRSLALGGKLYSDEATVENLCSFNASGDIIPWTLEAKWIDEVDVAVSVTGNDAPLSDLTIKLRNDNFTATLLESEPGSGIYVLDNNGGAVPQGEYNILINGEDSGEKTLIDGKADISYLSYYTVNATKDEHYLSDSKWEISTGQPRGVVIDVSGTKYVKANSEVDFTSGTLDTGYKFSSWISTETEPNGNWDCNVNPTKIKIGGRTELSSSAKLIEYNLSFESNKPNKTQSIIEGELTKPIKIRYNDSYKIPESGVTLKGYIFKGWNTKADGTGKDYEAGKIVTDNLSSTQGDVVKLYAQWKPITYYINFKSTRIVSGMLPEGMTCIYDEDTSILKNVMKSDEYHFIGWSSDLSNNKPNYKDEEIVKNLEYNNNATVTLWALWDHDSYRINYNANGGKGNMGYDDVWTNTDYSLSMCNFVRSNYKFNGWNTKVDGTGYDYKDGEEVNNLAKSGKSITLYAKWIKSSDGNRSNNNTSNNTSHNAGVNTGDTLGYGWIISFLASFVICITIITALLKRKNKKM